MLLSDRDIRAELEAGRVILDPFDPGMVQPSSVERYQGQRDPTPSRSWQNFHQTKI